MAAFFLMALVVLWNTFAPADYRWLSETARKLWAMAGLGLYIIILLERRRRKENE